MWGSTPSSGQPPVARDRWVKKLLIVVLVKAQLYKFHAGASFNERQRTIIHHWLEGFEGELTSSKWAKLSKSSHDTARRDLVDRRNRKILKMKEASGRRTSHSLCLLE